MTVLKMSAKLYFNSVAGASASVIRERGSAEIRMVGADALNQMAKAVAIARGFVTPHGIDHVKLIVEPIY